MAEHLPAIFGTLIGTAAWAGIVVGFAIDGVFAPVNGGAAEQRDRLAYARRAWS